MKHHLPFLILSLIVVIAIKAGKSISLEKLESMLLFIETNQFLMAAIALVFWSVVMYVSFSFSSRWYKKREF
ncbi:MAG TPA: hypothetical protein VLM88_06950 [Proteiniclasticum sp.]|nr:hypothetical protein [Proteiniclasticum sp.]